MIGWIIYGIGFILAYMVTMHYGLEEYKKDGEVKLSILDLLGVFIISLLSWVVVIILPVGMNWEKIGEFFSKPRFTFKFKK